MAGKAYGMKEMKAIVQYLVEQKAYKEVKGRQMWETFAKSGRTKRTWQSLKEVFLKRILPEISNPYYELTPEQISCFRCGYDVNKRTLNCLDWNSENSSIEQDTKKNQSSCQNSTVIDDGKQAGPSRLAGESKNSQNTIKSLSNSCDIKCSPATASEAPDSKEKSSSNSSGHIHMASSRKLFRKKKKTTSDGINKPSIASNIITVSSGSDDSDIDQRNEREVLKIKREIEETLCIADSQNCIVLDTPENEITFSEGPHAATTTKEKNQAREKIQKSNEVHSETKEAEYERVKSLCSTDLTDDKEISHNSLDDVFSRNLDLEHNNVSERTVDQCLNDSEETLILINVSDDEIIELSSNDDMDELSNSEDINSFFENVDVVKGSIIAGVENESRKLCNGDKTDSPPKNLEVGVTRLTEVDTLDVGNNNVISSFFIHSEDSLNDQQINVTVEKDLFFNKNLETNTQSPDISIVRKYVTPENPKPQTSTLISIVSKSEDLVDRSIECSKTNISEQNLSNSKVTSDNCNKSNEVIDEFGNCITSIIYLDSSESSSESVKTPHENNNTRKSSQISRNRENKIKITKRFCNDVKSSQSKRFKKSRATEKNTLNSSLKKLSQSLLVKVRENEYDMSKIEAVVANKNGDEKMDDSELVDIQTEQIDQPRSQNYDLNKIQIDCQSLEMKEKQIQETEILPEIQDTASAHTAILKLSQCDKTSFNNCDLKKTNIDEITQVTGDNIITSKNKNLETSILANKIYETQPMSKHTEIMINGHSNDTEPISNDNEIVIICDSNDTQRDSSRFDTEMHLNERIEIKLSPNKTSTCSNEKVLSEISSTVSDSNSTCIKKLSMQKESSQLRESCPLSFQNSKKVQTADKESTICHDIDTNNSSLDKQIPLKETQQTSSNQCSAKKKAFIDCDDDETNIGSLGTEIPLNIIREIWSSRNSILKASTNKEITSAIGDDDIENIEYSGAPIEIRKDGSHSDQMSKLVSSKDMTCDDNNTKITPKSKQIPSSQLSQLVSDKEITLTISDDDLTNIESSDKKKYNSLNQANRISLDSDSNIVSLDTQIPPNLIDESCSSSNQISQTSSDMEMSSGVADNDKILICLDSCIATNKKLEHQNMNLSLDKDMTSTISDNNIINIETLDTQIPPNIINEIHLSTKQIVIKSQHKYKQMTSCIYNDNTNVEDGTLDTQIPPNKVVSQSSSHTTQSNDSERISKSISGDNSSILTDFNRAMSKSPTQLKKCFDNKTITTETEGKRNLSGDISKIFGFSEGNEKPKVNRLKNRSIDTTADETIDITMDDPKDMEPESSLKETHLESSSDTEVGLESTFNPGNIKRSSHGNLMVVYGSKIYPLLANFGGDVKHMKWLPEGSEYKTSSIVKKSENKEGHVLLQENIRKRKQRNPHRSRSISSGRLLHTGPGLSNQTYIRSDHIRNIERRHNSGDSSDYSPIRARRSAERLPNKYRKHPAAYANDRHEFCEHSKDCNDCRMMTLRLSTDKDSVDSRECLLKPCAKLRRHSPLCDVTVKRRRSSFDIDRTQSREQTSSDRELSRDINWQKKCMESQDINVRLMNIIDKLMRDKTNSLEDVTRDIKESSPVFEVKSRKVRPAIKSPVIPQKAIVQEVEPDVVLIDDEDKCSNASNVTVQLPAASAHHIIKLATILQDTGVDKLDKILAAIAANADTEPDTAIKKRVDEREQKIFQEIKAMETGLEDAGLSPLDSIPESISNNTSKITKRSSRNSRSETKTTNDDLLEPEVAENLQLHTDEKQKEEKESSKVKSKEESQVEKKVTRNDRKPKKQLTKTKQVDDSKTYLAVPNTRNIQATPSKKSPSPKSVQKVDGGKKKAKKIKENNLTEKNPVYEYESDEEIVFATSLDVRSSKVNSSEDMSQDLFAVHAEPDTKVKSRRRKEKLSSLASSSIPPSQSEEIEDVRYMLPEMAQMFKQTKQCEPTTQEQHSIENSKVTKRREKANKRATSMDNFRAFMSSPETTNDYIDSDDTNISSENRTVKRRRKSERPNRHFRSSSTPRRHVQIYPDFIRRRRRTLTDHLKIKRIGSDYLERSSEKSLEVIQKQSTTLESYKSSMFETVDSKQNRSQNLNAAWKSALEVNNDMIVSDHSPHIVIDNRSQTIAWTTVSPCENSRSAKYDKDNNEKINLDNILQNSLSPIATTSKERLDRSREIVANVLNRVSSSPIMGIEQHVNSTKLSGHLSETIIEVQDDSTFLGKLTKNINGDLTPGGVSGIACLPDISSEIILSKTRDKSMTLKPQKRPRSKSSSNVTSNSFSINLTSATTDKSTIILPGTITRSNSANNVKDPNISSKSIPESLYKGLTDLSLEKNTGNKKKTANKSKSDKADASSNEDYSATKVHKKLSNKKDTIKVKILRPKKKHHSKDMSKTSKSQCLTIDHETPKISLDSSGLNSIFQGLTFDSVIHEPMSVKFDSICQDDIYSNSSIKVPHIDKIESISLDNFLGEEMERNTSSSMGMGSESHVKEEDSAENSSLLTLDLSDSQETVELDSQNNDGTTDFGEDNEYSSEIDFITPINTNFSDIVERKYNQASWYLLSDEESQSSPPRLARPVVQPVPILTNYPYINVKNLFTDLSIINEDSKEASRDAMIAKNFKIDNNFNTIVGQTCSDVRVKILSEPKLSEEEIFLTCPNSPVGSAK